MRAKAPAKETAAALTYEDVLRIVEVVKASQFSEFRLKLGETEVHLRRKNGAAVPAAPAAAASVAPAADAPAPAASAPLPSDARPGIPEGSHAVRAPMVGTFYCAPAPGAKPFVEVGDEVDADTTVGIIEVMKLMNSIPAGVRGVVRSVLVANAQYVEYGQPLVLIEARA
jgi:acetyl-CoA carboxylase biotin carboxyl carrier protein